jgi:hypothetical protein
VLEAPKEIAIKASYIHGRVNIELNFFSSHMASEEISGTPV